MRLTMTLLIGVFLVRSLPAQLPANFSDQLVQDDFDIPVGVTFDAAGTPYVWEKGGRVWLLDENGQKIEPPLIDIHEEVANWRDHGLLGFALDPQFAQNGHLYLLYIVDLHYWKHFGTPAYHPDTTNTYVASFGRITRYTADPATDFRTVLPESRRILVGASPLEGLSVVHESHSGGSLVFGTDGTLLASFGDGNSNRGPDTGGEEWGSYITQAIADGVLHPRDDIGQFRSQSLDNLCGKIIRIDPETGYGLSSNPFYRPDAPASARSRIWALGLRNPYRFTLRPGSGSHYPAAGDPGVLYVGDVGDVRWEELNVVTRGGQNFGWPITEGYHHYHPMLAREKPLNLAAPNPLFGTDGCAVEYFNYDQTFLQHIGEAFVSFPNPCDPGQQIPLTSFPMVETWPAIAWSNARWNQPARAEIGRLTTTGERERVYTHAPEAFVSSPPFEGFSSMAGAFYQGDKFPEEYRGKYFHCDYSDWIRVFDFDAEHRLVAVDTFHANARQIYHLTQHPTDGCLYYLNLQKELRKICYGGHPPPVARATADADYGPAPLVVNWDATASYSPFAYPLDFRWYFGDGSEADGPVVTHTYDQPGQAPARVDTRLVVTDSVGNSDELILPVYLNNTPPVITDISFVDGDRYPTDRSTVLRLSATATDAEHDGTTLDYAWQVALHHNDHSHPEPVDTQRNSRLVISPVGCDGELYWYEVTLRVSDPLGASTERTLRLNPNCAAFPAVLDPFSATLLTDRVRLDWTVGRPDSVAHFEVLRSENLLAWERLAVLASDGTADFQFIDETPPKGTLHYRVKLRTADGRYDYGPVRTVEFPPRPDVQLHPNPAREEVVLRLKESAGTTVRLQVWQVDGRLVLDRQWAATAGQPFEQSLNLRALAPGAYACRIMHGLQSSAHTLLVQ